MGWLETYEAYLNHAGYYKRHEVASLVEDARKLVLSLPESLRNKVLEELRKWMRDDFVEFSGFANALEIARGMWPAPVPPRER